VEEKNDSNFKKWLRDKKPVSELSLFQRPLWWLNNLKSADIHDEKKTVPENSQKTKSTRQKIRTDKIRTDKIRTDNVTGQQRNKAFKKKSIPVGYQLVGDLLKDELFIPVSVLTKHTVQEKLFFYDVWLKKRQYLEYHQLLLILRMIWQEWETPGRKTIKAGKMKAGKMMIKINQRFIIKKQM
jgi:hypothetical protein